MEDYTQYSEYAVRQAVELLACDSPTGYTQHAAQLIKDKFESLGCRAFLTNKGGVGVELGGPDGTDALLLQAHADTLGGMVSEVKSNGRLKIVPLNGLRANNCEAENCRVITRKNGSFEGTFQLVNPSTHVNGEYDKTLRSFDVCEVILDELTESAEETRALGVGVGDIVCFEPRTRVTASGYIKSRFLDDKLSVGILLAFAKYVKENNVLLPQKTYLHITVYEEVGHGAAAIPRGFENIAEVLAVDMGCVGEGLACTERKVSICAKDSDGPYSYDMVQKLISAAEKTGADYAVDIYPHYGSDAAATLRGGADVRHGLIGPGVFASHGYERSHKQGVENTLKVLVGLL